MPFIISQSLLSHLWSYFFNCSIIAGWALNVIEHQISRPSTSFELFSNRTLLPCFKKKATVLVIICSKCPTTVEFFIIAIAYLLLELSLSLKYPNPPIIRVQIPYKRVIPYCFQNVLIQMWWFLKNPWRRSILIFQSLPPHSR